MESNRRHTLPGVRTTPNARRVSNNRFLTSAEKFGARASRRALLDSEDYAEEPEQLSMSEGSSEEMSSSEFESELDTEGDLGTNVQSVFPSVSLCLPCLRSTDG